MRATVIVFLTFLLFTGCKKDKDGSVVYKMKYTSSNELALKASKSLLDAPYYTQFGDYITSVTPSSFIGEFEMIRIYGVGTVTDAPPIFMTLLQPSMEDSSRFADFSNNTEIKVTPTLNGPFAHSNGEEGLGYFDCDVVFKLLHIHLKNISQVVDLPIQYDGINLSQFNENYLGNRYYCDSVLHGNTLTVDMYPLMWKIYDTTQIFKNSLNLYFGMIDKTTLYTTGSSIPSPSSLNQNGLDMPIPFVWSNKYSEWTLVPPVNGETTTIISTIGFDNDNLIQIYAGRDNIPYTSDDIIIYAPNYWERIYIKVAVD